MSSMFTPIRQRGTTLLELLIAVGITMFLVSAAGYVYLTTRESQSALERTSTSDETGMFTLQLVGRDVMNAGFYPATMPPIPALVASNPATQRKIPSSSTYPPVAGIPVRATDWIAPAPAYLNPIFGCEGARFNHVTATCDAEVAGAPDSIVINYFTNESVSAGRVIGQRRDCTGSDVASVAGTDPSNAIRRFNQGGPPFNSVNVELAPQAPVFVSNRYGLTPTKLVASGQSNDQITQTNSLACSGNGSSWFGLANSAAYQPLVAGVDDLQFTYGLFNTAATRAPERFYTATEVNAQPTLSIDGIVMSPWSRVVAVRTCVMTSTLGGVAKIADKAGALRTYQNCQDATISQPASDLKIRSRHVQVFAVRNRLNQGF